jgi:hypothetical protein
LVAAKQLWEGRVGERGRVDFRGARPTFDHFGALVMLVPLLEVQQVRLPIYPPTRHLPGATAPVSSLLSLPRRPQRFGLDVVYLDIDIALVKDPLPFLARGADDISVSPEVRGCLAQ